MKIWQNILTEVQENHVEFIRFVYIDNDGVTRGYNTTPERLASDLKTGHNVAIAMPFFSVLDDLVPDTRFGCTGEVSAVPDSQTFRILPYMPNTAMLICDFRNKADHSSCNLCARSLLKDYLAGLDYDVNTAFENEFYLLTKDENGTYAPFDRSLCFATSGMDQQQHIVLDIVRNLKSQGMIVEKYYPEYGQGQVEIVYSYDKALQSADNQVFFRETVRGVTRQHDVIASFMPKPFHDQAGSGAHLHFSLFKDGKNLFYDPVDEHGLSQTAKYFIGGILKHLHAICAFTASTINSYKRLVPHHWASAYACYGLDNREAAVRVVAGSKGHEASSFNIEIKPTDPACNPYLAVLAVLAAGIDGIQAQCDPGQPILLDPDELSEQERRESGITRLPRTLGEAVDALEKDLLFKDVLGDVFWSEYILLKRFAWTQYIEHVSDWELQTYAEVF